MVDREGTPQAYNRQELQRRLAFGSVVVTTDIRGPRSYVIIGMHAESLDAARILEDSSDAEPKLGGPGTTRYDQVETITSEVWSVEQVLGGLMSCYPNPDMQTWLRDRVPQYPQEIADFKAGL